MQQPNTVLERTGECMSSDLLVVCYNGAQRLAPRENESMAIIVTLSPEAEAQLYKTAARQGRDVSLVAAELLASALEWEAQDNKEAVEGLQRGLDDFEAGRFHSFHDLAEEQRRKYDLPIDS